MPPAGCRVSADRDFLDMAATLSAVRWGLLSIILGSLVALALAPSALGATYSANAPSLGAIPDGPSSSCGNFGSPRDVTFTVEGLPTATSLGDVGVSFQMNPGHTWAGDLDVRLIAPDGTTSQTIFSRMGATSSTDCGDGSDIQANATYAFSDAAAASPSFLSAALGVGNSVAIPPGTYRASTPGGVANGNQNTTITPAFAGVTNPNGTWTLRFRDGASGDTGTVSAANLILGLTQRTLSVNTDGSGTGTVTSSPAGIDCGATCQAQFDDRRSVTLTATPDPGSDFAGWSGGGCSGTGICRVQMNADTNVTATFTRPTLTVEPAGSGAGTVTSSPAGIDCGATCSSVFDDGASVTLTAAADPGSAFTGWSGGGCVGTSLCHTTVSSDTTVTANFTALETLTVTRDGDGHGHVTSSPAGIACGAVCAAPFELGSSVTLTATPASGSQFAGWSGGGCSGTDPCQVAMDADRSVNATFTTTPPPDTEITGANIDQLDRSATFRFRAVNGTADVFRCALANGSEALKFRLCSSPVKYRRLDPGRYTFEVRALSAAGVRGTPAVKRFRMGTP
jgi:subtilisin-like proprotein convertase family protein